jgi:hypothetical protein
MCNEKHIDSKVPKESSGTGYKIFRKSGTACVRDSNYLTKGRKSVNGWIAWSPAVVKKYGDFLGSCGFCVIKNKTAALRAASSWGGFDWKIDYVVFEVKYKEAIWEHSEKAFTGYPVRMLLVRKFRKIKKIS